jgi:hypothetical protein
MTSVQWPAVAIRVALLVGLLPADQSHAQSVGTAFPRFHLLVETGPARGAGNHYTDLAVTAGVRVSRAELRLRLGSLVYFGGCDAIVPTKCDAGSGGYVDAAVAVHAGHHGGLIDGWTFAAGPGLIRTGNLAFIGAAVGRDVGLGRRGILRIELHGRHVFDDYYRATWDEAHRQFGLRIGIGLWSALDRLRL